VLSYDMCDKYCNRKQDTCCGTGHNGWVQLDTEHVRNILKWR
jgi:hypothetical protein